MAEAPMLTAGATPGILPDHRMARDIPLGNGSLLVAFDHAYAIRDLHYPNLGLENHLMGRRCRSGSRPRARSRGSGAEGWDVKLGLRARRARLGRAPRARRIRDRAPLQRRRRLRSARSSPAASASRTSATRPRKVRLFFHHDFEIMETDAGDTAHYDPRLRGHDPLQAAPLLPPQRDGRRRPRRRATTRPERSGAGTGAGARARRRTAERSTRTRSRTERSTRSSRSRSTSPPPDRHDLWVWIIAGTRYQDVAAEQLFVLAAGPAAVLERARVGPTETPRRSRSASPADRAALPPEPPRHRAPSATGTEGSSRPTTPTSCGSRATPTPTSGRATARWSRTRSTSRGGTSRPAASSRSASSTSRRAATSSRSTTPTARSRPRGTRGSATERSRSRSRRTRRRWCSGPCRSTCAPRPTPSSSRRPSLGFVRQAADFLYDFRDDETGLPLPSWDLWEERFGVHAFTVASVHAALSGAARLADAVGEADAAARWRTGAAEVHAGLLAPPLPRGPRPLRAHGQPRERRLLARPHGRLGALRALPLRLAPARRREARAHDRRPSKRSCGSTRPSAGSPATRTTTTTRSRRT